jgi:ribonuclease HI
MSMLNNTSTWKLFIDGAARNNPGPAGAGIYILKNDIVRFKRAFFLGIKTNNQAEYLALILGLMCLSNEFKKEDSLAIISDSLLLVKQMQKIYKVKHPNIIPLNTFAHRLLKRFHNYTIEHTLRHNNTHADALANHAVDQKVEIPPSYIDFLATYDIQI